LGRCRIAAFAVVLVLERGKQESGIEKQERKLIEKQIRKFHGGV
jgi:hypothetical protein